MCLKRILSKEKKKKIMDKIDMKGITVYKVIEEINGKYYPPFMKNTWSSEYKKGLNKAKSIKIHSSGGEQYETGFHLFKTKAGAKRLLKRLNIAFGLHEMIKCTVKKSWITAIGTERGYDKDGNWTMEDKEVIIVAKKAMFHFFLGKKKD